ncbi:unnamed protein product [Tuber aestivum]|uniref:Uncharacterized protein n=1 Tax=Tuber aestivum TaxID=59557 RepID=A0A292PIT4_9PEZI|nr:unnamed protein product [Tuber aestivum]
MFGRNFQASVPRTRTLILQNRQFSASSISNEGNNNDSDDKPKILKIPVDVSSLLRMRRASTPAIERRVTASAEDLGLDSPAPPTAAGGGVFAQWERRDGEQQHRQGSITSRYFSAPPPPQGPTSDQGPRIIAPRGGLFRGGMGRGFIGAQRGGGLGMSRGNGRGGYGGIGMGARGGRGGRGGRGARSRGRGRGRRGGDENMSSSSFTRARKPLPPPPELPESVYSPDGFAEAELMGYIPATQLTVTGGVSSGLLDRVPVTENTKGWSAARWQEYRDRRERAAKEVVAGEYDDPASDVGPYREVHRLITVNGSYTDKVKGKLFAAVKRNVPIELIPPPPGQVEGISAGEGN